MKFFTLPRMPIQIISHPTDTGWIFEDCVIDQDNPIYTTEEGYNDYGDPTTVERTEYPITHTIKHLKDDTTVVDLFVNRKMPWETHKITKIENNSFVKSETTISNTNLPYPKAFDYSIDYRYHVIFHITCKHMFKANHKSTYFGLIREGDRSFLEEKCKNLKSDSGVVIFDRNTGISEVLEPYPDWKLFRQPTVAISQDGLTIIACYTSIKDGTCMGAIFDNPLID
jgi:hypothetical protein